jgi:hypothetical protein
VFKDHPIHGLFEVTGFPAPHIQSVLEGNPLTLRSLSYFNITARHRLAIRRATNTESIPYISHPPLPLSRHHTCSRLQRWYIATVRQIRRRRQPGT